MNETNHPARRLRHGDRPTEPLVFEDDAANKAAEEGGLRVAAKMLYNALNDAYQASMFDGDELKRVVRAMSAYNHYRSSPAATLSPLCGAQHAESGKEAVDVLRRAAQYFEDFYANAKVRGCVSVYEHVRVLGLDARAALAAQQAAAPAVQPVQEQASTTRVTETKRAQLEARGYEVVGYVMQNSVNELCTLAHGRVEWLGKGTTSAPGTPEAPKGSIGDLTAFHIMLNWYDNEASYGSINEGRNKLTEYIDRWADRRAAQLDGGQEGSEAPKTGDAKDAARYRWLRDNCYDADPAGEGDAFDHPALHFESNKLDPYNSNSLDLAIDSDMRTAQIDGGQERSAP